MDLYGLIGETLGIVRWGGKKSTERSFKVSFCVDWVFFPLTFSQKLFFLFPSFFFLLTSSFPEWFLQIQSLQITRIYYLIFYVLNNSPKSIHFVFENLIIFFLGLLCEFKTLPRLYFIIVLILHALKIIIYIPS